MKEFPGCLPSQLLAEDANLLLRVRDSRRYFRAYLRVTHPDTTEADLDPWEIDLVMPNIERMVQGG